MAAKTGLDKDTSCAVYTKARNKSKTLLRKFIQKVIQDRNCSAIKEQSKEPEATIPTLTRRTNSVISELLVTERIIRLHLSKIKVNKSCGLGEVHPRMLLELAD